MALPSAFHERLEHMEHTRNQRLHLLQAEKELQHSKSQVLSSRLSYITSMEQRCHKLDRGIASQHFVISSLKSRLHELHAEYLQNVQNYRDLKNEVDDLEEVEKEKQSYYGLQCGEMEEFKEESGNYLVECQVQIEELKSHVRELKARFGKLQGNINHSSNTEIAAAETRKAELVAVKENLKKSFALNYQLREQLTKQLVSALNRPN